MNHQQHIRYSRNIALTEIGEAGQEKLLAARVLVIGAGGLGSPLLLYLASAGVGTIGIVDDDNVELCNLQRQIIHDMWGVGHAKTDSVYDAIHDLNPDISVITYPQRLTDLNIANILNEYDIVADGSDNFKTRYMVNDACIKAKKPLVSAAVQGWQGQLSIYKPYSGSDNPCYRCLFPETETSETMNNCSSNGVLGSIAGTLGTLQATEIFKEILEVGESLLGWLLVYDGLTNKMSKIKVCRDLNCSCSTLEKNL